MQSASGNGGMPTFVLLQPVCVGLRFQIRGKVLKEENNEMTSFMKLTEPVAGRRARASKILL